MNRREEEEGKKKTLLFTLFFFTLQSIVIGVLGFVESIIVAKLYANKYGYIISPNRELVALGISNLFSSFFQT